MERLTARLRSGNSGTIFAFRSGSGLSGLGRLSRLSRLRFIIDLFSVLFGLFDSTKLVDDRFFDTTVGTVEDLTKGPHGPEWVNDNSEDAGYDT